MSLPLSASVGLRLALTSDLSLAALASTSSAASPSSSLHRVASSRQASSSTARGSKAFIPEDGSNKGSSSEDASASASAPAGSPRKLPPMGAPIKMHRRNLAQQPDHKKDPMAPSAQRERNRTVASFYNQVAIDDAAAINSIRMTADSMLHINVSNGKDVDAKVVTNAKYLRRELPVRVAHRIAGIRQLPFIVGCNPTILGVHELYIRAFNILNNSPQIESVEDADNFTLVLKQLLIDHKDVVSQLAQGFKECRKHIKDEDLIRRYLDKNLTSRLGIRMLASHQIALRDEKPDHLGIFKLRMRLRSVIEQKIHMVQELSRERYGHAPEFDIEGHVSATFTYPEMPLDYILPELLKNALRATVESHEGIQGHALPRIRITIVNNDRDFNIRISDRGGGIPHDKIDKVMQYNFTTAEESTAQMMDGQVMGNMMEVANRSSSGPMHGYGFGLPVCRAYAEYLGGSLTLKSLPGFGTDVYLKLAHVVKKAGLSEREAPGFRI